jgi:hypothetical protein
MSRRAVLRGLPNIEASAHQEGIPALSERARGTLYGFFVSY